MNDLAPYVSTPRLCTNDFSTHSDIDQCMCSDFVSVTGHGACQKRDPEFRRLFSCFVDRPETSTCTDLIYSTTNPEKQLSAEACKIKNEGKIYFVVTCISLNQTIIIIIIICILSSITVCPTDAVSFSCPNYSSCIPANKLCNGYDDCGDNRDENPAMCK